MFRRMSSLLLCAWLLGQGGVPGFNPVEAKPKAKPVPTKTLLQQLGSWSTRKSATEALKKRGAAILPEIVKFQSKDQWQRVAMVRLVGQMKVPPARLVAALDTFWNDKSSYVRKEVVRSLRLLAKKHDGALVSLLKGLQDPAGFIRQRTADALGDWARKETLVVPALAKVLSDKKVWVRRRAVLALAKFGPRAKPAIPQLVGCLQDSSSRVADFAATALANIGEASVPALSKALVRQKEQTQMYAAHALGKLGKKAQSSVSILMKVLVQRTVEKKKNTVGLWAADALGLIGRDGGDVESMLLPGLQHPHVQVRLYTIRAVGMLKNQATSRLLFGLLRLLEDSSWKVRFFTLQSFSEAGPKSAPWLLQALSHYSPRVRALAAGALHSMRAKVASELLEHYRKANDVTRPYLSSILADGKTKAQRKGKTARVSPSTVQSKSSVPSLYSTILMAQSYLEWRWFIHYLRFDSSALHQVLKQAVAEMKKVQTPLFQQLMSAHLVLSKVGDKATAWYGSDYADRTGMPLPKHFPHHLPMGSSLPAKPSKSCTPKVLSCHKPIELSSFNQKAPWSYLGKPLPAKSRLQFCYESYGAKNNATFTMTVFHHPCKGKSQFTRLKGTILASIGEVVLSKFTFSKDGSWSKVSPQPQAYASQLKLFGRVVLGATKAGALLKKGSKNLLHRESLAWLKYVGSFVVQSRNLPTKYSRIGRRMSRMLWKLGVYPHWKGRPTRHAKKAVARKAVAKKAVAKKAVAKKAATRPVAKRAVPKKRAQ
ncbi:MAG: HEAT repeat domain-containing protein [Deltaproteobacteria bacterium]|nr:MAG: HEAT repeat domain-containing protein [Deltaproteobacteria bacterium]